MAETLRERLINLAKKGTWVGNFKFCLLRYINKNKNLIKLAKKGAWVGNLKFRLLRYNYKNKN